MDRYGDQGIGLRRKVTGSLKTACPGASVTDAERLKVSPRSFAASMLAAPPVYGPIVMASKVTGVSPNRFDTFSRTWLPVVDTYTSWRSV
jgi:hypothetical protein